MKKLCTILPLALILCFMVGCQDKEAMAELEEFRAQVEVEEQNKALFRKRVDEQNKGNTEFFNEFFAPDYAYYSPSNTQEPMSRKETQEMFKTHLISFPDYNWTIEELFAVKDRVIARISSVGTFEKDYYGVPATRNRIESSTIIIARIENGKIVEERKEVDVLNIMQQAGMELKPKEVKK
jgi:predicted ester cyclase